MAESNTFMVIGAAGDGKSSVIGQLVPEGSEKPAVGRRGDGVTKDVKPYHISLLGRNVTLFDTMGIGDATKGIAELITAVRITLEHKKVDGIVVTNNMVAGRVGLCCQIVQAIIDAGMVNNREGVSPWECVILCGTQRDRCDDEEKGGWVEDIGKKFFKDTSPQDHQITTSSAKEPEGLTDLKRCMETILKKKVFLKWDPEYDENNGQARMAAAVCERSSGVPSILELELNMHWYWNKLILNKTKDLGKGAAALTSGSSLATYAGEEVVEIMSSKVGEGIIRDYTANQAAKGVGSGVLQYGSEKVVVQAGAEKAVGKLAMESAKDGTIQVASRAGNFVVDVTTQTAVTAGIKAGTSIATGAAGLVGEFAAGQFGATAVHKKKIGLGAQVSTGTVVGACAGGPAGAAVGATSALVSWILGQVVAVPIERAIQKAAQTEDPLWIRYQEAKKRYEAEVAKHKTTNSSS